MTKAAILVLGILMAAACTAGTVERASPIRSLDELRAQRQQAANRQRRVIFNNDGNEPVYLCKTTSPEELLSYRTSPLAGSHVDAIFYCTWSSGFGLFTHGTKVGEVFATREAMFERNMGPQLLAAGTDPLRVMADFGRSNGIEVFWSFRLNDTHDGSSAAYGPVMFRANRLKREHPEWLIGSPTQKPKFGAWSAVDFARPEIRELAFRYVEEVCQNYDVAGVEIDFFRHPVFFKRPSQAGAPCNDDERDQMTEVITRIRSMTEREGMARGRPFLVAVRVPDSVEYCRAIGIDLERWLREGLVDLMITGGYFRLNDTSYSVALGRKHGVKVYPSLDEPRVRDDAARKLRAGTAAYRARALEAWSAGADGVYLFNAFDPKAPIWRELGSAPVLASADRDYFASVLGAGAAAGGAYPHAEFQMIPRLNPANPIALRPGASAQVEFNTGERSAAPAEAGLTITLRLRFKIPPRPEWVAAVLNGNALGTGTADGDWHEYAVPAGSLRTGLNAVSVTLAADAPEASMTDLRCAVRVAQRP